MGVLNFLSGRSKNKSCEGFFPTQEELNQKGFKYDLQQLKTSQLVTCKTWPQKGFDRGKYLYEKFAVLVNLILGKTKKES